MYKRSFLHRNFKMPSKQTGRQIDISRCPYSLLNFCWMVNAKCSFLSSLFDLNCQNPLGLCNFVAFFSVLYSFSVPLLLWGSKNSIEIEKEPFLVEIQRIFVCCYRKKKTKWDNVQEDKKKQQTYYLSTRSRCFSWDRHYVYATNCTPKTHNSILFLFFIPTFHFVPFVIRIFFSSFCSFSFFVCTHCGRQTQCTCRRTALHLVMFDKSTISTSSSSSPALAAS